MTGIAANNASPGLLGRTSSFFFFLLCIGASLAGGVIAFTLSIVAAGVLDAILSHEPQMAETFIILGATIIGTIVPTVVLRRKRTKYRRPVPVGNIGPPPLVTDPAPTRWLEQPADALRVVNLGAVSEAERDDAFLPLITTDQQPRSVPVTVGEIESAPSEFAEYNRYSVLSLLAMVCFGAFAILSYFLIGTLANYRSDVVTAGALVGTPGALAAWAICVVKALHTIELRFWRLTSTKVSIAMAIVLLIVVLGAFFYFAAATDVGPAACRNAGGCAFHGNLRPIFYAALLVVVGFIVYILKANYDVTGHVALALSLSVLQVVAVFLVVVLAIMYVFRQRSEPASHKRYW